VEVIVGMGVPVGMVGVEEEAFWVGTTVALGEGATAVQAESSQIRKRIGYKRRMRGFMVCTPSSRSSPFHTVIDENTEKLQLQDN